MLSQKTEQYLCELLFEIAKGEKQVEVVRQLLGEQESFEPYSSFRRLDQQKKKFINSYDIKDFLSENGFPHSLQECDLFIKTYDTDQDTKISYTEFLRAVLPFDDQDLREKVSQRPPMEIKSGDKLSCDVEYTLSKLIDREIQCNIQLLEKKNLLETRYDFSIADCFNTIDENNNKVLDSRDFYTFFRKNGLVSYEDELVSLHRRLDQDQDGKISYEDFFRGISIQESQEKAQRRNLQEEQIINSPTYRQKSLTRSPNNERQQYLLSQYTPQSQIKENKLSQQSSQKKNVQIMPTTLQNNNQSVSKDISISPFRDNTRLRNNSGYKHSPSKSILKNSSHKLEIEKNILRNELQQAKQMDKLDQSHYMSRDYDFKDNSCNILRGRIRDSSQEIRSNQNSLKRETVSKQKMREVVQDKQLEKERQIDDFRVQQYEKLKQAEKLKEQERQREQDRIKKQERQLEEEERLRDIERQKQKNRAREKERQLEEEKFKEIQRQKEKEKFIESEKERMALQEKRERERLIREEEEYEYQIQKMKAEEKELQMKYIQRENFIKQQQREQQLRQLKDENEQKQREREITLKQLENEQRKAKEQAEQFERESQQKQKRLIQLEQEQRLQELERQKILEQLELLKKKQNQEEIELKIQEDKQVLTAQIEYERYLKQKQQEEELKNYSSKQKGKRESRQQNYQSSNNKISNQSNYSSSLRGYSQNKTASFTDNYPYNQYSTPKRDEEDIKNISSQIGYNNIKSSQINYSQFDDHKLLNKSIDRSPYSRQPYESTNKFERPSYTSPIDQRETLKNRTPVRNNYTVSKDRTINYDEIYQKPQFSTSSKYDLTSNNRNNLNNDYLEEMLVSLFLEIISKEKKSERTRQDLSLRPDFKIGDLYKILDRTQKGFVSQINLEELLLSLNIEVSLNDIYLIMRRYDLNNDGQLRFTDIIEIITPKQKEYAKLLNKRESILEGDVTIDEVYSYETLQLLKELFIMIIEAEQVVDQIRNQFKTNRNFSFQNTFSLIDTNHDGYINQLELQAFFEKNNVFCSEKELKLLICRFDQDRDNEIGYNEYVQQLSLKSNRN